MATATLASTTVSLALLRRRRPCLLKGTAASAWNKTLATFDDAQIQLDGHDPWLVKASPRHLFGLIADGPLISAPSCVKKHSKCFIEIEPAKFNRRTSCRVCSEFFFLLLLSSPSTALIKPFLVKSFRSC